MRTTIFLTNTPNLPHPQAFCRHPKTAALKLTLRLIAEKEFAYREAQYANNATFFSTERKSIARLYKVRRSLIKSIRHSRLIVHL